MRLKTNDFVMYLYNLMAKGLKELILHKAFHSYSNINSY